MGCLQEACEGYTSGLLCHVADQQTGASGTQMPVPSGLQQITHKAERVEGGTWLKQENTYAAKAWSSEFLKS